MPTKGLVSFICGQQNNFGNESAKQSRMKLQSLFDTATERIERMRQTYGNDFDKKIALQDSLLLLLLIPNAAICVAIFK